MYQAYLKDIAAQLDQQRSLLHCLEAGSLVSSDQQGAIESCKRNMALNETVLRLEAERVLNGR